MLRASIFLPRSWAGFVASERHDVFAEFPTYQLADRCHAISLEELCQLLAVLRSGVQDCCRQFAACRSFTACFGAAFEGVEVFIERNRPCDGCPFRRASIEPNPRVDLKLLRFSNDSC